MHSHYYAYKHLIVDLTIDTYHLVGVGVMAVKLSLSSQSAVV
jgi:hypothetical protein